MSARVCLFVALSIPAAVYSDQVYEKLRDQAWAVEESDASAEWVSAEWLNLDALVAEVQRVNPSVSVALSTWREALAQYPQARSLADPTLTYGVAPLSLGSGDVDSGHRVELSQQFPWPGKRRLRGERELAEAEVHRAGLETIREALAQETRLAYYDYWYAHRAIEINAVNTELLDEYVDLAESSYAAGTTSRQDALQAEVEREHLAHNAIVLQRAANVARARINTLIRREPDAVLPPPPSDLAAPGPLPEPAKLRSLAIEERAELRGLSRSLESDAIGVALAKKEFYPDFTVFGGYNSLWQEDDLRPIVGASVNLPVRLGRRRAAVDEARAQQQRTESALERERYRIAFEVQEAYERLAESQHVVRLYQDRLLSIAEENLEAAEANYYTAEGNFLALLTAQRQLMDTQLGVYKAMAAYHQNLADLERAVGGPIAGVADLETNNAGH